MKKTCYKLVVMFDFHQVETPFFFPEREREMGEIGERLSPAQN